MFYLLKFIFVIEKGRLSVEGSGSYGGKIQMAKILSIEAEASQIRVAEVEVRGKKGKIHNCFCIPAPQGAVEDGQIRDTKTLGKNLKAELFPEKDQDKESIFCHRFYQDRKQGSSYPFCESKQDTEYYRGKCHRLFSH